MWANFLACYLWWLLAGVLIGWLLNYWLCKCTCAKELAPQKFTSPPSEPARPVPAAPVTLSAAPAPAEPAIDLAAAKLAGIKVKGADDLEVIEGIGPKICGLFHAAGFKTFMQVSRMELAQMNQILDEAGPRFRLANPETWAEQARLAANNRWTELKTLQDNLTAGQTVQQGRGTDAQA